MSSASHGMTAGRHDARVVMITGASSGIGRAAAHAASAGGDHTILVARGAPALRDAAHECRSAGAASVLVVPTDVGDDAAVKDLVATALEAYGRIDVLIHCAGVVAYGRTEDVPADVFEKVLRTNVLGSVNVSRHVLGQMRRQRAGSVVMVGSVIGHIAVPMMSPYVLSKWGIRALTRQLQIENRDLPELTVAYVAPGGVDTPIYELAGTYSGFHGRPPPPVASPHQMATIIMRRIGRQHGRAQTSVANDVIRFGFTVTPRLFDLLVGPLFSVVATDRTRSVPDGPGNVFDPLPEGPRVLGGQGHALVGIIRNLCALRGSGRRC